MPKRYDTNLILTLGYFSTEEQESIACLKYHLKDKAPGVETFIININELTEDKLSRLQSVMPTLTNNSRIFIQAHGSPYKTSNNYILYKDRNEQVQPIKVEEFSRLLARFFVHSTLKHLSSQVLRINLLSCYAAYDAQKISIFNTIAAKTHHYLRKLGIYCELAATPTISTINYVLNEEGFNYRHYYKTYEDANVADKYIDEKDQYTKLTFFWNKNHRQCVKDVKGEMVVINVNSSQTIRDLAGELLCTANTKGLISIVREFYQRVNVIPQQTTESDFLSPLSEFLFSVKRMAIEQNINTHPLQQSIQKLENIYRNIINKQFLLEQCESYMGFNQQALAARLPQL